MYEMEAFSNLIVFLQGETHILWRLLQNPDRESNPSILSEQINVTRPRITAILTSLRKKGYIQMKMSEGDRRRMRVILTPEGEAYINEKQAKVEQYFDVLIDNLGEEYILELNRLIDLTIKVMDKKVEKL